MLICFCFCFIVLNYNIAYSLKILYMKKILLFVLLFVVFSSCSEQSTQNNNNEVIMNSEETNIPLEWNTVITDSIEVTGDAINENDVTLEWAWDSGIAANNFDSQAIEETYSSLLREFTSSVKTKSDFFSFITSESIVNHRFTPMVFLHWKDTSKALSFMEFYVEFKGLPFEDIHKNLVEDIMKKIENGSSITYDSWGEDFLLYFSTDSLEKLLEICDSENKDDADEASDCKELVTFNKSIVDKDCWKYFKSIEEEFYICQWSIKSL